MAPRRRSRRAEALANVERYAAAEEVDQEAVTIVRLTRRSRQKPTAYLNPPSRQTAGFLVASGDTACQSPAVDLPDQSVGLTISTLNEADREHGRCSGSCRPGLVVEEVRSNPPSDLLGDLVNGAVRRRPSDLVSQ